MVFCQLLLDTQVLGYITLRKNFSIQNRTHIGHSKSQESGNNYQVGFGKFLQRFYQSLFHSYLFSLA